MGNSMQTKEFGSGRLGVIEAKFSELVSWEGMRRRASLRIGRRSSYLCRENERRYRFFVNLC